MSAVEGGNLRIQRMLVEQAAVDAGAATGENGRPLRLYHGTPRNFGFTTFRNDRVIFTTTSESVAHGYSNYGYTRNAKSYTEDDGTDETLIRNAKSVLGRDVKKLDGKELQQIHDKLLSRFKTVSDKITSLTNGLWNGAPEEIENDFWEIVSIMQTVVEQDNDLFDNNPENAEWVRDYVDRFFNDWWDMEGRYKHVREWYGEHSSEVTDCVCKHVCYAEVQRGEDIAVTQKIIQTVRIRERRVKNGGSFFHDAVFNWAELCYTAFRLCEKAQTEERNEEDPSDCHRRYDREPFNGERPDASAECRRYHCLCSGAGAALPY